MSRLADWLDLHDYGYPTGLLAFIAGGVALRFGLIWLGVGLMVVAFALCWEFG